MASEFTFRVHMYFLQYKMVHSTFNTVSSILFVSLGIIFHAAWHVTSAYGLFHVCQRSIIPGCPFTAVVIKPSFFILMKLKHFPLWQCIFFCFFAGVKVTGMLVSHINGSEEAL